MSVDSLIELVAEWRAEAEYDRRRGYECGARMLEHYAEELERRVLNVGMDVLTLEQAVEISGYSYSHLQDLVASGAIPNVGKKGSPRVLRKDLPRKPSPPLTDGPQLVDRVLTGSRE